MPEAAGVPGLDLTALLPAEAHRTDLCLDGWLRHSDQNPRSCTAVGHDGKSTEFMMALLSHWACRQKCCSSPGHAEETVKEGQSPIECVRLRVLYCS